MKRVLMILTALALAFGLTACGGGGGKVAGKANLKIAILNSTAEYELMSALTDAFTAENDDVAFTTNYFGSDYTFAMSQFVAEPSSMPDVVFTTGEMMPAWAEAGWFVDLSARLEADSGVNLSDYYESMIDTTRYSDSDDGIYFMPREYSKPMLYINKTIFNAAGVAVPPLSEWNYEKFLEVCAQLKAALPGTSYSNAVPVDGALSFNASYLSLLSHFGAAITDENGAVDFTAENNVEAYTRLYSLIYDGYLASPSRGSDLFLKRQAAMAIQVRAYLLDIMDISALNNIDFLPLPLDFVGVGASGYAVTSQAAKRPVLDENGAAKTDGKGKALTNEDAAYRFVKFIGTQKGQKIIAEMGAGVPVLKSMVNDSSWTGVISESLNHSAFISAPEKDMSLSTFKAYKGEYVSTLYGYLADVMIHATNAGNYTGTVYGGGTNTNFTALKANVSIVQNKIQSGWKRA